jgi:hypothetical protein
MRTSLVGAVMVGATVLVTPSAYAATGSTTGGCLLAAANLDNATAGTATGLIGDVSATTDSTGLPVNATVTCWVDVNGGEVAGSRFSYSGFGAQDGVDEVAFSATPDDAVSLCEQVGYGDGSTTSWCAPVADAAVPPRGWIRPVDDILDTTDPPPIDPTICPVLVEISGNYGAVTIGPDGDVYVIDPLGVGVSQLQDCPPYDTDPAPPGANPVQVFVAVTATPH